MIPKDPMILLSWVNTRLRDQYPDLDTLCEEEELDRAALEETLSAAGFSYDPAQRRFR